MIALERLEWAIDQHYKSIDRQNNQRALTKNWCLAVWLLLLALLITGDMVQSGGASLAISFLPILLFWLIEGLQASNMKILELRVTELEKIWLNEDSKIKKSDILFYGSHQFESSRVKLEMFIHAVFKMETVTAFYALLLGINLVASVIFYLSIG